MEERPRLGFEPEDDDSDTIDESGATKKSRRKLRLENFFKPRESSEDGESTPRQSRFRSIFRELFPKLVEKDQSEPPKVESQSDDMDHPTQFSEFPLPKPASFNESRREDSIQQPQVSEQVATDLSAENTTLPHGPEPEEDSRPTDESGSSEFLPFGLDIDKKDEKLEQDILPEQSAPEEYIHDRSPDVNPPEVVHSSEPTAPTRASSSKAEATPNSRADHSGAMLAFLGAEFLSRRRDKKLAKRIKNTESEISVLGEQQSRASTDIALTSKRIEQTPVPNQNATEQNNTHKTGLTEKIMAKESTLIASSSTPESPNHLQNQANQSRESEQRSQKLNILPDKEQAEAAVPKNQKEHKFDAPETAEPTEIKETYFDTRHEIKDDTGVKLSDAGEEARQEKSRREDAYHISEVLKQRNLPVTPVYADGLGLSSSPLTDTEDTQHKSDNQSKQYASAAQTGFLTALVVLAIAVVIGLASSII